MPKPLPPLAACQRTLARSVVVEGIGLHSGEPVRLQLQPAPVGHGLVFLRSDLPAGSGRIAAHWDAVVDTHLCTVLGNDQGARISTVEHLLSALAGCGIDNLLIVVDGPELPILDGSAAGWVGRIEAAGTSAQALPRRRLRLRQPLRVSAGDSWALLLPADLPRYRVTIDFAEPLIGRQVFDLTLTTEAYRQEIAAARTFGFAVDVEAMRAEGRARGGSLDNAVVVAPGRVLNPGGLRWPDEFVRHKLLDCIGDLYLAGGPIDAHLIAHRPGHALNHQLLRELYAHPGRWHWSSDEPCALANAA